MDEMLNRILDCMGPRHGAGKDLADYLGIHQNVITNWRNGTSRSYRSYLKQIARYFNVSVDYLLSGEQKETPVKTEERAVNDDDIKLALFGGDGEVTDEMWDEALFAVQLIKERHKREKEKNGRPLSDR